MKHVDKYEAVRRTQITLFHGSGLAKNDYAGMIELFGPKPLAEFLGVDYVEVEEIPSNDPGFAVAGTLDRRARLIQISMRFPHEQRRLTGLHELIHWMLHQQVGGNQLHRDRPISHRPDRNAVPFIEWEATNLACEYLMPEKLMKKLFASIFHVDYGQPLETDANVAFHLQKDEDALRGMDIRQKSFLLSTATFYGRPLIPLHRLFKVSPTAMAIRLQELELIGPNRYKGRPKLQIIK